MAVILCSVAIQFFTAFYALRLIGRTRTLRSWILISLALFLMGVRRAIPLWRLAVNGGPSIDYLSESVGLALSALMCAGVVGIGRVFVEREQAKQRIKTLLEEKDLLLKEVHHRMKNNMNTVCALLRMQADCLEDAHARETVLEASRRVESMFHLYDRVYRSDDFSNVRTRDYFSSLMDAIVLANRRETPIRTVFDIEDFKMDIQKTYYVGIILNELATNCIKHAFGGVEEPSITLTVARRGGMAVFAVRDNGKGMPERGQASPPGSFGMTLVDALVDQLLGTLEFERGEGTAAIVKIPLQRP